MFENFQICPYTGLRSFTEEESIYFKGRDEHIEEATAQLQRNKFLMVTGASGDGKSSLVYAGIIPNARAGFLKSKYTQWNIIDFRPERTPFNNLCKSIAREFEIKNVSTVEAELSHGFSALVDLYKNSIRYADPDSLEWINANEEERGAIKRRASNLIIIADQFEEFFTNPENYFRGIPSKESNLVINLLLETAKIALDENLPIYVVFTMRSDYIGQCTVFRGLPEYIGFSQFFVPRLNRKQLQDVIEEPAVLSGNKISRRLAERLIHDITEGVDQLPILQHALNQIWVAADNGQEEMDLIHYAMVGGLSPKELPNGDQEQFNEWFNQLPAYIKSCYNQPSLHNVLDTHANKLYEMAADYYLEKTGNAIEKEEAQNIIKIIFTCLTKIDQSRAVRNRMTLKEIHDIMENHHVSINTLAEVLNIFREPGNTLIRPFITDEADTKTLNNDDVLDITHESLIRNWELLKVWAKEEFAHYTTYQDFYQQVVRWIKNNRSRGFLLPIGPLTYFEKWFQKLNPSIHWIKRYLKTGDDTETLARAQEILKNSRDFIKLSARKHTITRAVMKFGARRIAAVLAILVLVVFSSFYYFEDLKKRNEVVISNIKRDAQQLIENRYSSQAWQTFYLISAERNNPGYLKEALNSLHSNIKKVKLSSSIGINAFALNKNKTNYIANEMLWYGDSVASNIEKQNPNDSSQLLLSALLEYSLYADYYNASVENKRLDELIKNQNESIAQLVLDIFKNEKGKDWNVKQLNEGIEAALNHASFSNKEIDELLHILSPLEGELNEFVSDLYAREKTLTVGLQQSKLTYNGLYQELAYLYAAKGDVKRTWQCVVKLFEDHPGYENYSPDAITVSAYFIKYKHWDALDSYIELLAKQLKSNKTLIYQRIVERSWVLEGQLSGFDGFTTNNAQDNWYNPVFSFLNTEEVEKLFDLFLNQINNTVDNLNEYYFGLATYNKLKATKIVIHKTHFNIQDWKKAIQALYQKSLDNYQKVSKAYLEEPIQTYLILEEESKREMIYLYPDYREKDVLFAPRSGDIRFYSSNFLEFVIDNNLFNEFYNDMRKLDLVRHWVKQYLWTYEAPFWPERIKTDYKFWVKLDSTLMQHPMQDLLDFNALRIITANAAMNEGHSKEGAEWAKKVKPEDLKNLFTQSGSGTGAFSIIVFELITKLYAELCIAGEIEAAHHIMNGVPKAENKVRLYSLVAIKSFESNNKEMGSKYLDSAEAAFAKIPSINSNFWDLRKNYAYAKTLEKGQESLEEVSELTRNMNSGIRQLTGAMIARGLSYHDQLYEAYNNIPLYTSSDGRLNYAGNILFMQAFKRDQSAWKEFDENFDWILDHNGYTP